MTPKQRAQLCETAEINFALKILTCPYLQSKIQALKYINDFIKRVTYKMASKG